MPIGLGTAIIGSTVLGVGGSIAAGVIGSKAAGKATDAQTQAAQQQLQLQGQIYNQQRSDFEPYRQFGLAAMPQLAGLLGISYNPNASSPSQVNVSGLGGSGTASQGFADQYFQAYPDVAQEYSRIANGGFGPNLPKSYDYNDDGRVGRDEYAQFHYDKFGLPEGRTVPGYNAPAQGGSRPFDSGGQGNIAGPAPGNIATNGIQASLEATPGYQFALSQGARAVDAGAANAGLVNSGARAKALTEFGQGLASQTLTQERNALFNALNVGTGASAQVAQAGQNYGNQAGQALQNQGNAIANGAYNRASSWQNAIGGVGNAVGSAIGFGYGSGAFGGGGSYGGLPVPTNVGFPSDRRLKSDVEPVGEYRGLTVYSWLWNDTAESALGLSGEGYGMMADEVEQIMPEAVTVADDGFKRVNYDLILGDA